MHSERCGRARRAVLMGKVLVSELSGLVSPCGPPAPPTPPSSPSLISRDRVGHEHRCRASFAEEIRPDQSYGMASETINQAKEATATFAIKTSGKNRQCAKERVIEAGAKWLGSCHPSFEKMSGDDLLSSRILPADHWGITDRPQFATAARAYAPAKLGLVGLCRSD